MNFLIFFLLILLKASSTFGDVKFLEKKNDAQLEWWYYTLHLKTEDTQRALVVKSAVFNASGYYLPFYRGFLNHTAVLDGKKGVLDFSELFNFYWGNVSKKDAYHFHWNKKGISSLITGDNEGHRLYYKGEKSEFSLKLNSVKPIHYYGNKGNFNFGGNDSFYYSKPRMNVTGWIKILEDGVWKKSNVSGEGYFEHLWSDKFKANKISWVWVQSNLSSGQDIIAYKIWNRENGEEIDKSFFLVQADGHFEEYKNDPRLKITSLDDENYYSQYWNITLKDSDKDLLVDLDVISKTKNQILTFSSPWNLIPGVKNYFEGSVEVRGTINQEDFQNESGALEIYAPVH